MAFDLSQLVSANGSVIDKYIDSHLERWKQGRGPIARLALSEGVKVFEQYAEPIALESMGHMAHCLGMMSINELVGTLQTVLAGSTFEPEQKGLYLWTPYPTGRPSGHLFERGQD